MNDEWKRTGVEDAKIGEKEKILAFILARLKGSRFFV